MNNESSGLIGLLTGLLLSIPISAQVVNATVRIDGMI